MRPMTIDETIEALQAMRAQHGGDTTFGLLIWTGGGHGDPGWVQAQEVTRIEHYVDRETWPGLEAERQFAIARVG